MESSKYGASKNYSLNNDINYKPTTQVVSKVNVDPEKSTTSKQELQFIRNTWFKSWNFLAIFIFQNVIYCVTIFKNYLKRCKFCRYLLKKS